MVIILGGQLIVPVNYNHIFHYHMDAHWPAGLVQAYFASPDYSSVQDWIHATFLSPDSINLTEPLYIIILSFQGAVGYMPLGIPCTRPVVVISFGNPGLPFVLTAYPAF